MKLRHAFGVMVAMVALMALLCQAGTSWAKGQRSGTVEGVMHVNLADQTVTVDGTTLKVTQGTYVYVDWEEVSLADLAGFLREREGITGRAEFIAVYPGDEEDEYEYEYHDEDDEEVVPELLATEVEVNTTKEAAGSVTVDLSRREVTCGGVEMAVTPETGIWIDFEDATLEDLARVTQRHPEFQALITYRDDNGNPTALEIDLSTEVEAQGRTTVDLRRGTFTVDGVTMAYRAGWTYIRIYDTERREGTLADVQRYVASHPHAVGQAYAYYEGDAVVAYQLYVRDDPWWYEWNDDEEDNETDAFSGARARGGLLEERREVGTLDGLGRRPGTFGFRPQTLRGDLMLRARRRSAVKINGVGVTYEQFALAVGVKARQPMSTLYLPRLRTARRVWVEPQLRLWEGKVLSINPRNGAMMLSSPVRGGAFRYTSKVYLFSRTIVMKGKTLVRVQSLRPGDYIRYDFFKSGGKDYVPRIKLVRRGRR